MKHQAIDNIQSAIRRILSGNIYLSDEMQAQILDRVVASSTGNIVADPVASLTNREFEILRLIGFGFGTRQISEKLKRSIKTIEAHRAKIKSKLGLKTGVELVRYATVWVKSAD